MRVSKGDAIAFERLYHSLCDSLAIFSTSHVGAKDLTDDVVQETFCRVWEFRTRFVKNNASAKTYIFGIALNVIRENKRRIQRKIRRADYEPHRLIAIDPHDAFEIKGLHAAVEAAKDILSDSLRNDIRLVYECGKSISEVADERVSSQKAVRCRLDRAYRRICDFLLRKHLHRDSKIANSIRLRR